MQIYNYVRQFFAKCTCIQLQILRQAHNCDCKKSDVF